MSGNNNKENLENQEENQNSSNEKELVGLNPTYGLQVLKYLFGIAIVLLVLFNYSFLINKTCFSLASYFYKKHDFKNQEKILKFNIFMQGSIGLKKSKYYESTLKNIIYFYEKQWLFEQAEYWQRKYIEGINNQFRKIFANIDLSYFLQKQGKYQEAEKVLINAEKTYNTYIKKQNIKNHIFIHWDIYFYVLYIKMGNIEKAMKNLSNILAEDTELYEYNYYNILKDMNLKNYIEALSKIEKEMTYNTSGYKGHTFFGGQPIYLEKILSSEIYRNILRLFLLEIYKDDYVYTKKILDELTYSQKELYGFYSPENLCNEYRKAHRNFIDYDKSNISRISSQLLYFYKKPKDKLIENVSKFCSISEK